MKSWLEAREINTVEFPILWNFSVESTNFSLFKKWFNTKFSPNPYFCKHKRMGYKIEYYLEKHISSLFNLS